MQTLHEPSSPTPVNGMARTLLEDLVNNLMVEQVEELAVFAMDTVSESLQPRSPSYLVPKLRLIAKKPVDHFRRPGPHSYAMALRLTIRCSICHHMHSTIWLCRWSDTWTTTTRATITQVPCLYRNIVDAAADSGFCAQRS